MIAQMKGFGALNATLKTSALCKVLFMKKSRKPGQNGQKGQNSKKKIYCFVVFFFLFFRKGTLKRAEVFCVAFTASKPFI